MFPMLNDATGSTSFDRHYVFHIAWAARKLALTKPCIHVDISSSLYFAAILSAYVKIEFYDYRPAKIDLDNLTTGKADLLNLHFKDNSISSLSCMHVIEHIGLGRYGDPIDPLADQKAAGELVRVLSINGRLLIVVPVGKPRICFNAHRIYSFEQVISLFKKLELVSCALIPDADNNGNLIINASPETMNSQLYGCGCFDFVRKELD